MKKSLLLLIVCLCLSMSLTLASCTLGGGEPTDSDASSLNTDSGSATAPSDNQSNTQDSTTNIEEDNGEAEHTCYMEEVSKIDATFEEMGSITYRCSCGNERIEALAKLEHSYSSTLTHNGGDTHWYACIDDGYEELKSGESLHHLTESDFNSSTGYATYSCNCGYSEQYLRAVITSDPTVSGTVYIGQKLSDISLTGGSGSVEGLFVWSSPETIVTEGGSYNVTFVPTSSEYASIPTQVQITATQLT